MRVLDAVRSASATTRSEIAGFTGLGRNVVSDRAGQLVAAGLLAEGELGRSTGGRAPRELRFRSEAGVVLVAELGATSIDVAASDLAGNLSHWHEEPADVTTGPNVVLSRVAELFDEVLTQMPRGTNVWGIGLGLPAPVEFDTGTLVSPPIMPGWDGYDVRGYFGSRFQAPVWVDNDVNVMALGELRGGFAAGHRDFVFVKVGTGIGAGLVSKGELHRGAQTVQATSATSRSAPAPSCAAAVNADVWRLWRVVSHWAATVSALRDRERAHSSLKLSRTVARSPLRR